MDNVKSFSIEGISYNVARATAVQQDEVLSLLTSALIQRFAAAGQEGIPVDEKLIHIMMMAIPFQLKTHLDELLLGRVTKLGETNPVTPRDFDGRVMELNLLRAKVLMWNLEGFFAFWAKESAAAIESQKT